ncbi:hypothetical protein [Phenylobacterium deserti]|uniref:Uncharacterized protein n=1 Tax=Phenylobacterium deserti TaxID=1914756 RepID=A0A328ARP0_9CAUL|nr:hypothetical protein [Phenylobacterium deserti]RAK57219.1 hypothetical protein DJ018_04515 [Phenylobacterium deserti]
MPLDLRRRSPLLLERIREVEVELAIWARRAPDPQLEGDLFAMMELLYSYPKRADDLASSAKAMMHLRRLTPAVILSRALIETVAMGCFYVHELKRLISAGDAEALKTKFDKFYAGRLGEEVSPVHVNDALRYLEKIDNAEDPDRTATEARLEAEAEALGGLDLSDPKFVETSYGLLCEIAHPSCVGTHLLYPAPGGPDIAEPKQRLEFAAELAIWQAQYLLEALKEGEEIPALHRQAFG